MLAILWAIEQNNRNIGWYYMDLLQFETSPYLLQHTYYRPSWMQVLEHLRDAHIDRYEEVNKLVKGMEQSEELFLNKTLIDIDESNSSFREERIVQTIDALSKQFDETNGSFGATLKFPGTMALNYLLKYVYYKKDRKALNGGQQITDWVIGQFFDSERKMFYFTSEARENIPLRRKDVYESAIPSGNSTMAHNFKQLSLLLGRQNYLSIVLEMLRQVFDSAQKYLSTFANWAGAILDWGIPYFKIAVLGDQTKHLAYDLLQHYIPNKAIMATEKGENEIPLLKGKGVKGDTNTYVCKEYECQRPVKTVEEAMSIMLLSL